MSERSVPQPGERAERTITTVTIVNGFGDSNLGGAAITRAAILLGKEIDPDASVKIVSVSRGAHFDYTRATSPDVEILAPPFAGTGRMGIVVDLVHSALLLLFPGLRWRSNPTIDRLRATDHAISKGGYVFRERVGYAGFIAGWFTMWPLVFARRCGATTVAYSASVGPWQRPVSRWLSRLPLHKADVINPRDPDSTARTGEMLPRGTVVHSPDCVFGLWDEESLFGPSLTPDEQPARTEIVFLPRRLGKATGLIPVEGGEPFWQWQLESARTLLDLFPGLTPVVLTQTDDEVQAAYEFAAELGFDPACVERCHTPRDAIVHYQRAGFAISNRMHGGIFATMSGCPTLLVDIAAGKSRPVFDELDLDWVVIPPTLSQDELVVVAKRVTDPEIHLSLDARVREAGARVRRVRTEVADLLRAAAR